MDREIRSLPEVAADAEFQQRLKSAFVEGEFAEQPKAAIPIWRWLALPAAAVLIVVAILAVNRGPVFRAVDAYGDGMVTIDGEPTPTADLARLTQSLTPGSTVAVPNEAGIDVAAGDVMLYEIVGGTEMTLPESPGRWFGRAVECSVFVGELRLMTGEEFTGSTFTAYTPDGMIQVTGTLLSIQCDEGGTCVCVLEGTAQVGTDETDLEPVSPGFRKIMLKDGTVEIIPVKPMHRDGVLDFESRMKDQIAR